jgi:membrane-associated phospholipid phosphatase
MLRTIVALLVLASSSFPVWAENTQSEEDKRRFFALRPSPEVESLTHLHRNLALETAQAFRDPESKHILAFGLAATLAALPFDEKRGAHDFDAGTVGERRDGLTRAGYWGGNALTTFGIAGALYGVGRITDRPRLQSTGQQALESLLLTHLAVEGLKQISHRARPDGTNYRSFPSGHAASTFALAAALERNYGLKAGIPAYTLASFVAFSRVHGDRHYLSDVVLGAAIGIAIGRTVAKFHQKRMVLLPLLGKDTRGIALSIDF